MEKCNADEEFVVYVLMLSNSVEWVNLSVVVNALNELSD